MPVGIKKNKLYDHISYAETCTIYTYTYVHSYALNLPLIN